MARLNHPCPKIVVVTGGSAGVGRAVVREFARRGADVGIIARDPDRLRETAREVEEAGRRCIWVAADVSDAGQVEQAAETIERELGPIECWVNNAMTSVFAPVMETTPEEFERVMRVTFLGYVHGTQSALRRMQSRDGGTIIQVSSALAYRGIPLQAPYCAAKHAIVGFTDSLRSELARDRSDIRVCMVHLPGLNTPQFEWVLSRLPNRAQPVPPIFQPEVAARAIVNASLHRRREVTVGFPTLQTIWGGRLAPGFADRYLARKAWEGQQTDEPRPAESPSNLWSPVAGDFSAHGRFDSRARNSTRWVTTTENWDLVAIGAAIAMMLLIAALLALAIVALD